MPPSPHTLPDPPSPSPAQQLTHHPNPSSILRFVCSLDGLLPSLRPLPTRPHFSSPTPTLTISQGSPPPHCRNHARPRRDACGGKHARHRWWRRRCRHAKGRIFIGSPSLPTLTPVTSSTIVAASYCCCYSSALIETFSGCTSIPSSTLPPPPCSSHGKHSRLR